MMEDMAAKRARLGGSPFAMTDGQPSEGEILQLVSQREAHRQRQQFQESDQIRQQLRDLGVELYDKDREWRCKDGRRGVLFTAGPFECTLSNEEIAMKVEEREEARRSKDWDKSNLIRDELRMAGVELNDKESVWRTLAGRQNTYAGGSRAPQLPGNAIHQLIVERERMREAKDFAAADDIRTRLAQHGVEIFDSERLWKTSDGQQGVIITGGHEVVCTMSDHEISQRVEMREQARSQKNWAQGDQIRDDLRRQGIEVLDNQKIWCTTDGRQGPYPGSSHSLNSLAQIGMSGAGTSGRHQSQGNNTAAQALALLAQKGQLSSGLGSQLGGMLGGALGGALGGCGAAAPSSGGAFNTIPGAPRFSDASIVALISAREAARERHDWMAADAIRGDLRNHGVEVWDKEKMWKAEDGRHGQMGVGIAPGPAAKGNAGVGAALALAGLDPSVLRSLGLGGF